MVWLPAKYMSISLINQLRSAIDKQKFRQHFRPTTDRGICASRHHGAWLKGPPQKSPIIIATWYREAQGGALIGLPLGPNYAEKRDLLWWILQWAKQKFRQHFRPTTDRGIRVSRQQGARLSAPIRNPQSPSHYGTEELKEGLMGALIVPPLCWKVKFFLTNIAVSRDVAIMSFIRRLIDLGSF